MQCHDPSVMRQPLLSLHKDNILINDSALSTELDLYSSITNDLRPLDNFLYCFLSILFYPLQSQTRFFTLLKIITFYSLNEQTFVECLQCAKNMVSGNLGIQ